MAKLTSDMLTIKQDEAAVVDYGTITIKLNAGASSVDISVTRDLRVLKDDEQSTRPGRVLVHSQRREG